MSSTMPSQDSLNKRITEQLAENRVMLYMKGDKIFPNCGFSARVVDILSDLQVDFETHDVLSDPELRTGMKNYSNWPTFPQLFVDGQLIGGCDIVSAMAESGELQKLLKDKGLLKA